MELARLTPVFDLFDWMSNLGGLVLWIAWRAIAQESLGVPRLSIASTLRRTEAKPVRRWVYLASLVTLLFLRSILYWQLGGAAQWLPTLNLGAIALTFRSDLFGRILLFSFASFGITLFVFHCWLLLPVMLNRRVTDADAHHRMIRGHLGIVASWPLVVLALLPLLTAGLSWWLASMMLVSAGLLPRPLSSAHAWQQASVIGLCAYLCWKWLIVGVLLGHLVNSYVYLGQWGFWHYLHLTARQLLRPLRWIPLRIGKVDFSPVAGMLLIMVGAQLAVRSLHALYRRLPF